MEPVYYTDADYTTPLRTSTNDAVQSSNSAGSQDFPYIKADTRGNTDYVNCTANGFRLPRAAEWTDAAKAGTSNKYAGTNDFNSIGDYAWTINNSANTIKAVATKLPNEWGLYDMNGNVDEFVYNSYLA